MKRFLAILLIPVCLHAANPDDFWKLYEAHPNMQDFFPFGVYGAQQGQWSMLGHEPRAVNELILERMAENGFNIFWETATHRHIRQFQIDGLPAAEWTPYGRWWYGEALPAYGMKTMPRPIRLFTRAALGDFKRHEPPLDESELAAVSSRMRHVLRMLGELVADYPDTIYAIVSDDEPRHLAPMVAADRLLREATGRAVTTCIPSWGQSRAFAPHMQPFTGDWYVTKDVHRNNWAITERLDWMRENLPDRVFWFLPLATGFSHHEPTKPGMLEASPQPVDVRMQFWMAIGGGAKGFFYYNFLHGVQWARGEDNLFNAALVPNNDLWDELGRLGTMITSAGPLLLSCRPVGPYGITIETGQVRYAEYEGEAVSVRVLRDIHRDRYIVVPYSNDLHERQTATLTLPAVLAGRQVFDLASLTPVSLDNGRLTVDLAPGDGRLLLLTDADEIAEAKSTVNRHRAGHARRLARIALRRERPGDADTLLQRAAEAETRNDWVTATADWNALRTAAIEAFERGSNRALAEAAPALDEIGRILTESHHLFRTHRSVLALAEGDNLIRLGRESGTRYAAREVGDWLAVVNAYISLQLRYRADRNMHNQVRNTALTLRDMAAANQTAIRALIDQRLAEVRHPLQIACITGDRLTIEYHANIAWFSDRFTIRWFAPDADGALSDQDGKAFSPHDFDAVWIQQLRFSEPPTGDAPVDPRRVLMPALVAPRMIAAMQDYLRQGGGLVLNGIAGLYTLPLGLESELPDRLQQNGWYQQPFAVGVAAAPGFAAHPIFKGLDAEGYISNGSHPDGNLVPECAWQDRRPSGRVVAVEYDELFGAIGTYAAIVEYTLDAGRALVLGGRALDLTPDSAGGVRFDAARRRNRTVLENAILYAADGASFEPEVIETAKAKTERQVLPEDAWRFRIDPDTIGIVQRWFAPNHSTANWELIRIGLTWNVQGHDTYTGSGWYQRDVELANRPGKRTLLHFGAVDEEAIVWLDGREIGRHEIGSAGWDKPFHFDITTLLGDGPRNVRLTVRARNTMAAGGIWRPIWIEWE